MLSLNLINDKKCVKYITDIHKATFQGFFLSFLGKGFLKEFYSGFIMHDMSGIIGVYEDTLLLGFAAYSCDSSGFYKYLLKKKLIKFFVYSFIAFLKKPKIAGRLFRAFKYPRKNKSIERFMEVLSIGVLPDYKNQGLGSMLLKAVINMASKDEYSYVKLDTDSDNNEAANAFYRKNGFKVFSTYATPEGRNMTEYRYYF